MMHFKKKLLIIVLSLCWINGNSQNICSIDFGDYFNSEFEQSDCTYKLGAIPMQFFNIYESPGQDMLCSSPQNDAPAFKAKIEKKYLPLIGSTFELSVTQIDCSGVIDFFEYSLHYEGGQVIMETGESVTIQNFNELEYLTVTEIECGLIGYPGFVSPVIITFEKQPDNNDPNDCNDNDISDLEGLLSNPANTGRADYHFYLIDDASSIVCSSDTYNGSNECTIDGVWEFVKANNIYQAPTLLDYPSIIPDPDEFPFGPFKMISSALTSIATATTGPYGVPIENCDEMQLTPSLARVLGGVFFNIPTQHDCVTAIDIINEPIKIVVDEERRCITNYTLDGHILYPGKVERCVTSGDCGETIQVITKGTGFHYCGDTDGGSIFSYLNKKIGVPTFESVNQRLNQDFND